MRINEISQTLSARSRKTAKAASAALLAGVLLLAATGCGTTDSASSATEIDVTSTEYYEELMGSYELSDLFSDRDLAGTYDESEAVTVTLSDSGSEASGSGVSIDGSTVTITEAGTYVFSGTLSEGQILVKAGDSDKVQIVLNGVTITNSTANAIYAQTADKVFVTAAEGTTNTLTTTGDAVKSDTEKNLDGVIFSECDITINGTGTINVESATASGIVGKDDVKLAGVTMNITAAENGIEANDSIRVASGTCTITATEDGVHSDNSEEPQNGYFYMFDGTITITAGDDGIHASSYLTVNGGTITITQSGEGLEAAVVTINDGTVDVTASDDGINASSGGGGDGFMGGAPGGQMPGNGQMPTDGEMPDMSEMPTVGNATTDMQQPADGQQPENGAAPADMQSGDGQMQAPPDMNGQDQQKGNKGTDAETAQTTGTETTDATAATDATAETEETTDSLTPLLTINGGTIHVNAGGDGLDSNGDLIINGGTTYVSGPTNDGNTAVDFGDGCTAVQNGGVLIAAGSSGMAEAFDSSSTQGVILATLDEYTEGEITLTDSNGNVIASYTPDKKYNCVIISAPEVASGSTYTLTTGGGTATKTITMDSNIYSEAKGFGAMGGGKGGGKRMNRDTETTTE